MKRRPLIILAFSIAIGCCAAQAFAKASHDDLARRPTWSAPTAEEVRQEVEAWWQTQSIPPTVQQQLSTIWSEPFAESKESLLDRLVQSVALVDPRAATLVDQCLQPRTGVQLEEQSILLDEELPEWIRNNLSLYYGQWLTGERYYDEARGLLVDLTPEQVCDPAALLFYQAVIHHRLLEKDACLAALKTLLQNEPAVPQRYTKLARLMEADLRPLETDSLDEVARLMESIRVRLGHARAGKRVRQEEEDVIAKLDKMIKQLEDQASQAAAAASASGNNSPSAPMQDSMPGGQTGPGNVNPKKLGSRTDWGNLPPKEREQALQQLGKDLPSHYRDVIEGYFRKLAQDGVSP